MNLPLDQAIDAAHAEAERIESEARQIEARILKAGGIPPRRPYGRPVNPADISANLTLVGQINNADPALASYLGIQSGAYARREQEAAARQEAAVRMAEATEALRQRNAAARQYREAASRAGVNPWTGVRKY